MSRHGDATFTWGGGVQRTFRLGIGQLRELQEATGIGPLRLLNRIKTGDWQVGDLTNTIRIGLIGGGTDSNSALALVAAYVENRPLIESVVPAARILMAALFGPTEDPAGKKEMGAETMVETLEASSALPPSMEPAP